MKIAEYKLTSPKIKGEIVFIYHGGILFSLLFRIQEPLTEVQWQWLCRNLPYIYKELDPALMNLAGVPLQPITPGDRAANDTPAMEKVRMFQEHYLKHIGIPYVKQAKDHLLIKSKDVTPKLLDTYFTSDNVAFKKHHAIGNFCKFHQELCAEAAGAYTKLPARFPDHYSAKFEKTLSPQELSNYWKHLNLLGWTTKKVHGRITDWIPPITTNGKEQAPTEVKERTD